MKTRQAFVFSLAAMLAAMASGNVWDAVQLKGRTDKDNPVAYAVDEPIVFTLEAVDVPPGITNGDFVVEWKRTGDDGRTERGMAQFKTGEVCKVTTSLDRPGFVRLEAYVKEKTGKAAMRDRNAPGAPDWQQVRIVFFDGGAGVDVGAIAQEKEEPEDFDQWWDEQKRLLATVPPEATLKELPDDFTIDWLRAWRRKDFPKHP